MRYSGVLLAVSSLLALFLGGLARHEPNFINGVTEQRKLRSFGFIDPSLANSKATSQSDDPYQYRYTGQPRARSTSTATSDQGSAAVASGTAETNGGLAVVHSSADSSTYTAAKHQFKIIIGKGFDQVKAGGNAEALAYADARAVGTAVAAAYAKTLTQTYVAGDGKACGSASASAEAVATAFARAYVGAIAEVKDEYGVPTTAVSSADSIAAATAHAFATAKSSACTTGGYAASQQQSLAASVATAYADALAIAYASVSKNDATAQVYGVADTDAEGKSTAITKTDTTTVGTGIANGEGTAAAASSETRVCSDKYEVCCSSYSSCPARKTRSTPDTYTFSDGHTCYCDNSKLDSFFESFKPKSYGEYGSEPSNTSPTKTTEPSFGDSFFSNFFDK